MPSKTGALEGIWSNTFKTERVLEVNGSPTQMQIPAADAESAEICQEALTIIRLLMMENPAPKA